jgi:hypothetical protein
MIIMVSLHRPKRSQTKVSFVRFTSSEKASMPETTKASQELLTGHLLHNAVGRSVISPGSMTLHSSNALLIVVLQSSQDMAEAFADDAHKAVIRRAANLRIIL